MNKHILTNIESISVESVLKFSYFVGGICILMIVINIWFVKEMFLKIKLEESKYKLLLGIFYIILTILVSLVLLFFAINCFIL